LNVHAQLRQALVQWLQAVATTIGVEGSDEQDHR
jgi:hypothetical protein